MADNICDNNKNVFYFENEDELHIESDSELTKTMIPDRFYKKYELEKNKKYPLDLLTESDLEDEVNYSLNPSYLTESLNVIRRSLKNIDKMNEVDKAYLDSIAFMEEDYDVKISDMNFTQYTKSILYKYRIIYLWQLLLIDYQTMVYFKGAGEKTLLDIVLTVRDYGYALREYEYDDKYEEKMIEVNKYLITQTREAFTDRLKNAGKASPLYARFKHLNRKED